MINSRLILLQYGSETLLRILHNALWIHPRGQEEVLPTFPHPERAPDTGSLILWVTLSPDSRRLRPHVC